jgi:hypothetical protein
LFSAIREHEEGISSNRTDLHAVPSLFVPPLPSNRLYTALRFSCSSAIHSTPTLLSIITVSKCPGEIMEQCHDGQCSAESALPFRSSPLGGIPGKAKVSPRTGTGSYLIQWDSHAGYRTPSDPNANNKIDKMPKQRVWLRFLRWLEMTTAISQSHQIWSSQTTLAVLIPCYW